MSEQINVEVLPPIYQALHAKEKFIYIQGGVGSGKSFGIGDKLVQYRTESSYNRCLLGANTYSQLRDSTVEAVTESLMRYGLYEDEHFDVNWSKKIIDLQGMRIFLRSFENDINKSIAGMTLHKILLDEFAFFGRPSQDGQYIYNKLLGRMRGTKNIKGDYLTHQFCAFSSPNGYNHCNDIWVENATKEHLFIKCATKDNIFLPDGFYDSLVAAYGGEHTKLALQELFGEFVDLVSDRPYWGFNREKAFQAETRYKYKLNQHIDIMHDFNIGVGKPMSLAVGQFDGNKFHVAKTICIESMRTEQIMEELASYGVLELPTIFRVFGDATGKNRDTRNNWNDYEIIERFLSNYKTKDGRELQFELHVPRANPRIRTRHNIANLEFQKDNVKIYKDAKTASDGFLKTKFLKASNLIEDDSLFEQHVTTAITYWIHYLKIGALETQSKTYKKRAA